MAVLIGAAGLTPGSVVRHNRLVRAEPGADSTVSKPPAEIRLWFKEPPELAVSSIRLTDAASRPVATGEVRAVGDKASIAVTVGTSLSPGKYTVTWKTAGSDGHVIRGSFGFTVGT